VSFAFRIRSVCAANRNLIQLSSLYQKMGKHYEVTESVVFCRISSDILGQRTGIFTQLIGCLTNDVILCCCVQYLTINKSDSVSRWPLLWVLLTCEESALIQISHYCRSAPPSLSSKCPEWTLSHILFSTTSYHSGTSSHGTLAVRQVHSCSRRFPESYRNFNGMRFGLFEVILYSLTRSAEYFECV